VDAGEVLRLGTEADGVASGDAALAAGESVAVGAGRAAVDRTVSVVAAVEADVTGLGVVVARLAMAYARLVGAVEGELGRLGDAVADVERWRASQGVADSP